MEPFEKPTSGMKEKTKQKKKATKRSKCRN
jgi:hypothetical protein